jgi:hypothetical protein
MLKFGNSRLFHPDTGIVHRFAGFIYFHHGHDCYYINRKSLFLISKPSSSSFFAFFSSSQPQRPIRIFWQANPLNGVLPRWA